VPWALDGVYGVLCGRPDAGFIEEAADFLAGNIKYKWRAARLRAAPENIIEQILPAAPLAGLIAPRGLLLGAPRGLSKARAVHRSRRDFPDPRPPDRLTGI
jgi:hypothetical protein